MKFVNLRTRTAESVKNVSVNIDAIQSAEQLRTAFPHELTEQQLSAHRAVMTYDSYKEQYICNVHTQNLRLNIPVTEDCQNVYLITLSNSDAHVCLDDDLPVAFAELLGF